MDSDEIFVSPYWAIIQQLDFKRHHLWKRVSEGCKNCVSWEGKGFTQL